MKVIGSIIMYSGGQNPERELSETEIKHILDLVSKVDQPYQEELHPKLGFSGYSVGWDYYNEKGELNRELIEGIPPSKLPPVCIQTFEEYNAIGIYENLFMSGMSMYYDTVGLGLYLKDIMASTLQKHIDEAQKAMDEYNEEMLRATE